MISDDRAVVVRTAPRPRVTDRYVEICEHKGPGHPDTMMDGACEAVAREFTATYQREYGHILQFNVDKGLLVAGRSQPRFRGGRILKPAKIIVYGRTANPDGRLDVEGLAEAAVRRHLRASVRAGTESFFVMSEIGESTANFQQIYTGRRNVALANDTLFGVGFAPLSELAQKVLQLAATLRSPEFRNRFPAAGDDFKIMGLRVADAFTFTIAIATVDAHVESVSDYFEIKRCMQDYLATVFDRKCSLIIDTLDDSTAGDESGLYLTVSGLSAEMGDDGQVGRGNRVNGLITPGRPMSLEAAGSKNPLSHVGKIYSILAHRVAAAVCAEVPEVKEANVQLLSMIGQPIDRPQIAVVKVLASSEITDRLTARIAVVVTSRFEKISGLTGEIIEGMPVKAGDVLAQLDDADFKAQLAQAEAEVAALQEDQAGVREQIETWQYHPQSARVELLHYRKLRETQTITPQQLDQVSDRAREAEGQVTILKTQTSREHARVEAAGRHFDWLALQIKKSTIETPIEGTILAKAIESGELASVGQVIAMPTDLSDLELTIYIPEIRHRARPAAHVARGVS